jgi:hypothetical protein
LHGLGVSKDKNKAFEWFEKAAKQGLSYALNLVVFYSPCSLFNLSNAVGACGWLLSFAL